MAEVLGGALTAYAVVALKDDGRIPVTEEQRIGYAWSSRREPSIAAIARSSSVRTSTSSIELPLSSSASRSGAES